MKYIYFSLETLFPTARWWGQLFWCWNRNKLLNNYVYSHKNQNHFYCCTRGQNHISRFVLNIIFMIGPVQNVCVCKIWYYHYARLWLFMYQDWRTNCYYIKTIYQENVSRHARRDPPSSLEHNVMIWVFNCLVQNQIKCNVFSDVLKGRGRLLSCKLGCHFLVNTTS